MLISFVNLLPSLQLQVPTDSASISCTIVIIFGGVDSNPVIELYNLPDLQHTEANKVQSPSLNGSILSAFQGPGYSFNKQ
jgi:hypothetical protein